MDLELQLALAALEATLASGDRDAIQKEVTEIRATGIFAPEMYEHLNNLGEPEKQLRAIIDCLRIESPIAQTTRSDKDIDPEAFAAFQALSKMPYDKQLDMLEAAVDFKAKEVKSRARTSSTESDGGKWGAPPRPSTSDYVKNIIFVIFLIGLGVWYFTTR